VKCRPIISKVEEDDAEEDDVAMTVQGEASS
jgi:hypothetical protein